MENAKKRRQKRKAELEKKLNENTQQRQNIKKFEKKKVQTNSEQYKISSSFVSKCILF